MGFQKKALKNTSSLLIFTHTSKRMGYEIIPKLHVSSRECMNSRCRRFDLLLFAVLAQSDAAIIAVVAAHVHCRWRSIDHDRRIMSVRCFIYTIILSVLANSRSQFLLDRLGRCLKLFVLTESISCREFASQFGLAIFLYAKNTQNYREYRVARANVYSNEAATCHCSPVTVDQSPATT